MGSTSDKFNIVDNPDNGLFGESSAKTPSPIKSAQPKDNMTMDQKMRQFVVTHKPTLYILTPCYGGQCFVNYVHCLMATVELFRNYNIPLRVEFCKNDSLVTRARNNLIARAMSNPEMTHILFIDADITWDPVDIFKLLLSNKHLVGGVYPLKSYNWDTLVKDPTNPYNSNVVQTLINKKNQSQFKDSISDSDMVQYNMVKYNVNYLNNTLCIEDNLAEVKHLATGFMMIQRDLIEKMMLAYPSTKYVDDVCFLKPEENKYAYALFDTCVSMDPPYRKVEIIDGKETISGKFLSEDWILCDRASAIFCKIYIDVSISLTHSGICDYRGAYIASII